MNEILHKALEFLNLHLLPFVLHTQVGYAITVSLLVIFLTGLIKKIFRNSDIRKRLTPIVSLTLGLVASTIFYTVLNKGILNLGEFSDLTRATSYGTTIAILATGFYIFIKRIFGKKTNEEAMNQLLELASKVLPKGLALVSAISTGKIQNTEEVYLDIKAQVIANLNKGVTEIEPLLQTITPYIKKITKNKASDLDEKARELVEYIVTEVTKDVATVQIMQKTNPAVENKNGGIII